MTWHRNIRSRLEPGIKIFTGAGYYQPVHGAKSVYENMIRRKPNDPAWYTGGLYHDHMSYELPTFWFVSWYDVSSAPNLALIDFIRAMLKSRA